jgi:hypothetical protein
MVQVVKVPLIMRILYHGFLGFPGECGRMGENEARMGENGARMRENGERKT